MHPRVMHEYITELQDENADLILLKRGLHPDKSILGRKYQKFKMHLIHLIYQIS